MKPGSSWVWFWGFYQKTPCFLKGHFHWEIQKGYFPCVCLADSLLPLLLQGQAVGGLCLGPGSPASSPQIDAAEPAGEQSGT